MYFLLKERTQNEYTTYINCFKVSFRGDIFLIEVQSSFHCYRTYAYFLPYV